MKTEEVFLPGTELNEHVEFAIMSSNKQLCHTGRMVCIASASVVNEYDTNFTRTMRSNSIAPKYIPGSDCCIMRP